MKKKILIFILISLGIITLIIASPNQEDERPIGYTIHNKTLHIWNEIDDYYFNITSGIQFTNNYDEYWSNNIFCGGINLASGWEYYCNDELPFNWIIETDNETYINITGYKDVNKIINEKEYIVRFALRYNLNSNQTFLNIQPYEKNIGVNNITIDTAFALKVKNINISMDTINDFLQVEYDYYNLSENRNETFSNLNISDYLIRDIKTEKYIWINWSKNLNYKLIVNSTSSQYNAPITLFINAGILNVNMEKSTTFGWIDAECTWTCNYNSPTSQVDILENQSYSHSSSIDYLGTCVTTGAKIETQYNDTADGLAWLPSNGTNNLTTSDNPALVTCLFGNCPKTWVINATEDNQDEGMYNTRDKCTFNRQFKYDTGVYINVSKDTTPPTISLESPPDNITTLNSTLDFICHVKDIQSGVKNVEFYINWTNLWAGQYKNSSGLNDTNYTFSTEPLESFANGTEQFDLSGTPGVNLYFGLTTNGSDFWVPEFLDKYLYHYDSAGNNATGGFNYNNIGASNTKYVTTNGSDFWLLDDADDFVYHTNALGNNITDGFSTGVAGAETPVGITTNGSDFWITDSSDDWLYHFDSSGNNVTDGFNLSLSLSENIVGITTNGSDFWMAETIYKKILQYNYEGTRLREIDVSYLSFLGGLTSYTKITYGSPNNFYMINTEKYYINNITRVTKGYYQWNCKACDNLDNCDFAIANFSINISDVITNCWTYNSENKFLAIPTGCLFTGAEGILYNI